jgi:hypothetical protein
MIYIIKTILIELVRIKYNDYLTYFDPNKHTITELWEILFDNNHEI